MASRKQPGCCASFATAILVCIALALWDVVDTAWEEGNYWPAVIVGLLVAAAGVVAWAVQWLRNWI